MVQDRSISLPLHLQIILSVQPHTATICLNISRVPHRVVEISGLARQTGVGQPQTGEIRAEGRPEGSVASRLPTPTLSSPGTMGSPAPHEDIPKQPGGRSSSGVISDNTGEYVVYR